MRNGPKRKLGWLPGSYHVTQHGHYQGGPNARGAFDGTYDNGPPPPPPAPPAPAPVNRRRAANQSANTAPTPPKSPPPPPVKPKSWKQAPFSVGEIILCGALKGVFAPCECGSPRMTVVKGRGAIPAYLECEKCRRRWRALSRKHVAGAAA